MHILRIVFVITGLAILGATYKGFNTGVVPWMSYAAGAALIAAVFFGYIIGGFCILGGIAWGIFSFLGNQATFADYAYPLGLIVAGAVLTVIGAEGAGTHEYFCAHCDQYLGNEAGTCPRCGSNRYIRKGLTTT